MAEYIEREAARQAHIKASLTTRLIDAIPAADVAEVRHGRWIVHFDYFAPDQKCSVCGFEIPLIATENEAGMCLYKHCPECAARMDQEDEHEAD